MDELAVKHHDQTIRQFEQLVEVLADQQDRGAAVARCRKLRGRAPLLTDILQ
jgi:hypothetical protein